MESLCDFSRKVEASGNVFIDDNGFNSADSPLQSLRAPADKTTCSSHILPHHLFHPVPFQLYADLLAFWAANRSMSFPLAQTHFSIEPTLQ